MPHTPIDAAAWRLLLTLALLWGGAFVFARVAVAEIPPLTLALLRLGLAAAVLGLLARRAARPAGAARARRGDLWVMATFGSAVPFALIFYAQTRLGAGVGAVLNAMTPLFGVLVGAGAVSGRRIAALLVGVAGVAVLAGPGGAAALDAGAVAAGLGAAFSYAVSGLFAQRLRHLPPLPTVAGYLGIATALVAGPALLLETPWRLGLPSAGTVAAVLALAGPATALAYLLFFRLVARAGAGTAMLVTLLIPVVAAALGALLLGEPFGARHAAGLAMVGAALIALDGSAVAGLVNAVRRTAPPRRPRWRTAAHPPSPARPASG